MLVSSQPVTGAPVVAASSPAAASASTVVTPAAAASGPWRRRRRSSEPVDSAGLAGEPVVEDLRGLEKAGAAKVLRVLEHQEKVEVANQDPDQLHHSAALNDQVEAEQHPRQVHRLKNKSKEKMYKSCTLAKDFQTSP